MDPQSETPLAPPVASPRRVVLRLVVAAIALAVISRILGFAGLDSKPVDSALNLSATAIACLAAVYLIMRSSGQRKLIALIVLGAALAYTTQVLRVTATVQSLDTVPLLGTDTPSHHHVLRMIEFASITALLTGLFLSILELHDSKTSLTETAGRLAREIAEHEQTGAILRENEERYRSFAQNFHGIAFRAHAQTWTPVFFHGAVEEITGYKEQDFISGKPSWDQVIHPDDFAELPEKSELASTPDYSVEREYRIIRKDGQIRWVCDSIQSICNESGEPVFVQGAVYDITERKKSEEELQRYLELERLVATVSTRFVGMSVDDIAEALDQTLQLVGEFMCVDRCYVSALSVDRKVISQGHEWCAPGISAHVDVLKDGSIEGFPWAIEILGRGDVLHIPRVADLPPEARATKKLLESQDVQSAISVPLVSPKGLLGFFGFDMVREEKTWGEPTVDFLKVLGHVFGNAIERKRAEEERQSLQAQVQQAQKLESLGVLTGGIAHDFNNLLMAILGNADLAIQDLPEVSPVRLFIEEIDKASRRAADLCRQMLAYSGHGRFVVKSIDVNELVEEMAYLLKTSISKKIALNLHLKRGLPGVEADAAQTQQVVMNLITNASEAVGEESGEITISTGAMVCSREYLSRSYLHEEQPEGDYVYVEVADTGCGMDEETRAKIFEPFFSTKFTGRGLGLAATLGIVRGHKGAIMLDSTPGEGTTFRVLFPALAEEADASAAAGESPTAAEWAGCGPVLLVDDEEAVQNPVKRMLERMGLTVLTASDGREAVDLFTKHSDEISCVLLDFSMPRMDGEETLRELRRVKDDVRVILSSGYPAQHIEERFAGQDIAAFVQKPYQIEVLAETLRAVLGPGDVETSGC